MQIHQVWKCNCIQLVQPFTIYVVPETHLKSYHFCLSGRVPVRQRCSGTRTWSVRTHCARWCCEISATGCDCIAAEGRGSLGASSYQAGNADVQVRMKGKLFRSCLYALCFLFLYCPPSPLEVLFNYPAPCFTFKLFITYIALLTHTYPHKTWRKLKRRGKELQYSISALTNPFSCKWNKICLNQNWSGHLQSQLACIICCLMSDLVNCKYRKEYGYTWHWMSLLRPSVIKQHKILLWGLSCTGTYFEWTTLTGIVINWFSLRHVGLHINHLQFCSAVLDDKFDYLTPTPSRYLS